MANVTPMMRQYLAAKEEYPDAILLFRMGDFYEMFFEDAKTAAQVLDLTLTSRDKNSPNPVPMAGIPYHALQNYLGTLVRKGFNVAICEQVEDPKTTKGIVKREVVRVITPGTLSDTELLEANEKNFLAAVGCWKEVWGLSFVDVSTGEFYLTEFDGPRAEIDVTDELGRIAPAETLLPEGGEFDTFAAQVQRLTKVTRAAGETFHPKSAYHLLTRHFQVQNLKGFGCEEMTSATAAAGANLAYLLTTQKTGIPHVRALHVYQRDAFMAIDDATRRNLELTRTIRENKRRGSLLDHLDATVTAPGSRLLSSWLVRPLLRVDAITRRLEGTEELREQFLVRHELREALGDVRDLERLAAKVGLGSANARDLVSIRETLHQTPVIQQHLAKCQSAILQKVRGALAVPEEFLDLLDRAFVENPPATVREGGMIATGYNAELDDLHELGRSAKSFITDLETREREATGLNKLKVKFNNVFGYFIEIPRAQAKQAPEHYIRKQTLVNAERYITPELKEFEEKALTAKDRIVTLEYDLFTELLERVREQIPLLQRIAEALAVLDVLSAFAQTAQEFGYVRPDVNEGNGLRIVNGRHPVVEGLLGRHAFVANDCHLGEQERRLLLITGPNMAGKSTYIRQVALIVLMAQIGSFVPADQAIIGLVDRIFTRVGASDSLAGGESTFMVEMNETANILNNASSRSLIILDEIGRGTSTFDGLSIAWATAEYLLEMPHLKARTLFATHYHEMTDLAITHAEVANVSVAVKEHAGDITFLHKVVDGAAGKSFGIQVARLAGMPREVIERATELLENLEAKELDPAGTPTIGASKSKPQKKVKRVDDAFLQLSLFSSETDRLRQKVLEVVPEQLTPMEALQVLSELKKLV